jgi:hypothetical protein
MISPGYRAQVELLLRIVPEVANDDVFAVKGGTAINLFVRDMPRLSVDIDLTYLPLDERSAALLLHHDPIVGRAYRFSSPS